MPLDGIMMEYGKKKSKRSKAKERSFFQKSWGKRKTKSFASNIPYYFLFLMLLDSSSTNQKLRWKCTFAHHGVDISHQIAVEDYHDFEPFHNKVIRWW